jgi:thiol:disulfide interchange protein
MNAAFFWVAAGAGALALLTPCVLPMVPISMAYFSASSSRRGSALREALAFALGIVTTFTAVGVGLAVLIGATGIARLAANPWTNLVIGVSFVAFALGLLGAYEISVPFARAALERSDRAARARAGSVLGGFFMGVAFSIASFTCTVPFAGPLLVAAARGEWHAPVAGMLVFSSVFAAPFILLSLVPQLTEKWPRYRRGMRSIIVVVALAELGAAVKFFSNADLVWRTGIISRETMIAIWLVLALLAFIVIARPLVRTGEKRLTIPRFATLTVLGAASVWLALGLRGNSLGELEAFLPPDLNSYASSSHSADMRWILNDHPAALAEAQRTGRFVLIDFTGYTCTNCRWMEARILSRPDVSAALGNFVLSRLYTDGDGELYARQQQYQEKQFGTVALPLYAIIDARGKTVRTFAGLTRSPAEFLAFLRAAS